ncbi:Reticulocyte-binding protein 2 like protein a [Fusarium austroafricanum]|uniref:EKC/KEOPS complex subunit BUD32 n=1 Tax=Fusarium austroafricanum TaxID=2364996 RepID=A0A8H4KFI2_9HYPO|nr:Reticulocyte-binding protein 2 like protein a [Fusarium austroafricanum]
MDASRRIEELERQLELAQQRQQEAERQTEEARQRAEEARQRAEVSERETQRLALLDYLRDSHDLTYAKLTVETNPYLTSKGSVTNPRDKWCPAKLTPWIDFLEVQKDVFGALFTIFPTERRLFENRAFLVGLGERIACRPIADEKMLERFLHEAVEDPVRAIIEELKQVEDVKSVFDLGNGVVFENHPHAISDVAEEVVERQGPPAPPRTPDHRRDLGLLRPDQICIYRSDDNLSEWRRMLYVAEYKPPHKLSLPHLRAGLRSMDIHREVVNRETIPTSSDTKARFQYNAERLTAAAVTQTYHYMIESGLEYGVLTTGEAFVFLKIDWAYPQNLQYHLTEPIPEALAHPENAHLCTAVAQYLSFTLLALGSPGECCGHGQEERRTAMESLKTWTVDFESTLRSIPKDERTVSPDDGSEYEPTTYIDFDRTPSVPRRRTRRMVADEVGDRMIRRNDRHESSDDESAPRPPDTPSPSTSSGRLGSRRSQRIALRFRPSGQESGQGQGRQYCTQQCLLGLKKGDYLDPGCPNAVLHKAAAGAKRCPNGRIRHPISYEKWLEHLRKQLVYSLDDGIVPLGMGGARGVIFQVTLLKYGYTFVSKGTVRAFIPDLQHEAAVYERCEPCQGKNVPVFLGQVDLRSMNKTYYYAHRVYVVYMAFMSWGGQCIDRVQLDKDGIMQLEAKTRASLTALHRRGVIHEDIRAANILYDPQSNNVMLIDFERAMLLEKPRHRSTPLVPNQRKSSPKSQTSPSGQEVTQLHEMAARTLQHAQYLHEKFTVCASGWTPEIFQKPDEHMSQAQSAMRTAAQGKVKWLILRRNLVAIYQGHTVSAVDSPSLKARKARKAQKGRTLRGLDAGAILAWTVSLPPTLFTSSASPGDTPQEHRPGAASPPCGSGGGGGSSTSPFSSSLRFLDRC